MGGGLMGSSDAQGAERRALSVMQQEKAQLEMQLRMVEESVKRAKSGDAAPVGALPMDTMVDVRLVSNEESRKCELCVRTNNETLIKSVIVFCVDSGVFESESLLHCPQQMSQQTVVPINSLKDVAAELVVKVVVGARGSSSHFHVFQHTVQLPRFAMYLECDPRSDLPVPESSVSFNLPEHASRVATWIEQAFNVGGAVRTQDGCMTVAFMSLRDGFPLWIRMTPENGGRVEIQCDSIDLAADVVQDMCTSLQVSELESEANFPVAMELFQETLQNVDEYNAQRVRLTAEMADCSNQVKSLVIRAEDARIVNNFAHMKRNYAELFTLNQQLLGEYTKRSGNHQALLACLKEVNMMIQKAARLRTGRAKSRVVSACRKAIKANNVQALFFIIKHGRQP